MRKAFLAALATPVVVLGLALAAGPVSATPTPGELVWKAQNGGAKALSPSVVRLQNGNTSLEAEDLGVEVIVGTPVSFKYVLEDGATCGAGAPRVFFKVGANYYNSFDGNPDQCGNDQEIVTFKIPTAGKITHAGVVYDSGQQGTIKVKNLTIAGIVMDFQATVPTPPTEEPTATPTTSPPVAPTTTPPVTPSTEPDPTDPGPTPSNPGNGGGVTPTSPGATTEPAGEGTPDDPEATNPGELVLTGKKGNPIIVPLSAGVILLCVGGILVTVTYRRRTQDNA